MHRLLILSTRPIIKLHCWLTRLGTLVDRRSLIGFAILPLFAVGACEIFSPRACTLELAVSIQPGSALNLQVGQRITPNVALSSCGGREELDDTFTWVSSAPTVAPVNATSGEIVALEPGTAQIDVTGAKYGRVAAISVTVQ